jgi:hypothetical protein
MQLVPALLSRTELHALVWAEPLRHLARRFGISDQCLAKLCDRFDIPRPRPGHWNKVAVGTEIAMPVPPPAKAGMDETIEITPQSAGGTAIEEALLLRLPAGMGKRCAWRSDSRIRILSLPDGLQIGGGDRQGQAGL